MSDKLFYYEFDKQKTICRMEQSLNKTNTDIANSFLF